MAEGLSMLLTELAEGFGQYGKSKRCQGAGEPAQFCIPSFPNEGSEAKIQQRNAHTLSAGKNAFV